MSRRKSLHITRRTTYDSIMRWVNFAILAFLIIKFLRTPLKNFAKGLQEKVTSELRRKEQQKEAADDAVKEIRNALNSSEARFVSLKDRIVAQGEKKKQQIIEDGKAQSRQMLTDAKIQVENQIHQAKNRLKSELVEVAIVLAIERLPEEITEEDNRKLIDNFLTSTETL